MFCDLKETYHLPIAVKRRGMEVSGEGGDRSYPK